MALFTKIQVIPHDLYLELKGNYEGISFSDDSYYEIERILKEDKNPVGTMELILKIKRFVSFPYIQYDPENPSYLDELMIRVGQVHSLFDQFSEGNQHLIAYISSLMNKSLTAIIENVDEAIDFVSREAFKRDFESKGIDDNQRPLFHYKIIFPINSFIENIENQIAEFKSDIDLFHVIEKLGLVNYLSSNWALLKNYNGKPAPLGDNETHFAKVLHRLFGFKGTCDTVRTYLRDYHNKPASYTPTKKETIDRIISADYKIKKMPPE